MKNILNIGVIGCGYWGPNLIRNFHNHSESKVRKVADLKKGRLEFIKNLYPDIITTDSFNDILMDNEIDCVVIATPVDSHKNIAVEALKNGKHIFVEKPFADNYKDSLEILNLSEDKNLVAAVGHIFQFAPAVISLKDNIKNGLLGKVYHYDSQRINLGPPKTTVDVVWDLGAHDLSILLHLYEDYPINVNAYGESYWWNGIIDNAHIFLEFPDSKTAHIHTSWLSSNKTRLTTVFGEHGNILYDETKPDTNKLTYFDKGIDNRINSKDSEVKNLQYGKGVVKNLEVQKSEPLFNEIDAFIKSIKYKTSIPNDAKIGCEVVKILEEASNMISKNKKNKINV